MKIIKIIFFICFSFLINLTYAQVFEDDSMLFLGINAEKKINDKFTIALNEQVRFNQNISNFQQANTTLLLYYKINKNSKVDVGYNNRQKKELEDYSNRCIAKCLHILADLSGLSFDKSSANAASCIA